MAKNLKLKAARAVRDMTQADLAAAVGVSRQTINAIEKGEYNPTINLCRSISPREMAAEFFIFMLGCAYSVISDLRAGIWDRHLKANTKTNAAVSVVGGVAVLVWGLIKFAEFGAGIAVLQAVIMGVCTWVLCFALLQLSMKAYKKRHAELENPKEDDDENE